MPSAGKLTSGAPKKAWSLVLRRIASFVAVGAGCDNAQSVVVAGVEVAALGFQDEEGIGAVFAGDGVQDLVATLSTVMGLASSDKAAMRLAFGLCSSSHRRTASIGNAKGTRTVVVA